MGKPKDVHTIPTSFFEFPDGTLIEQIYRDGEYGFIVYRQDAQGEKMEFVPSLECDGRTFEPIAVQPVQAGALKLPSDVADAGTESTLLTDLRTYIHEYLQLDEFSEELAMYYVLLSWLYDKFSEVPFLRFKGDYGTGKSRALKVVGGVCYKVAMFTAGSSLPSLFRTAHMFGCTICVDEADFSRSDLWAEVVKFLNSRIDTDSYIWRTEEKKKEFTPRAFNLFGPTLLATRNNFHDEALESRCITIPMMGRTREDIPLNLNPRKFQDDQDYVRKQLLLWRLRNYRSAGLRPEYRVVGIEDRLNQIVIPLISVIRDEAARRRLGEFMKGYDRELKDLRTFTREARILQIIDRRFEVLSKDGERTKKEIFQTLGYKTIVAEFNESPDQGEKPMPTSRLGYMLKNLGIEKETYARAAMVQYSERNRRRLEVLKEKYGVKDDAVE